LGDETPASVEVNAPMSGAARVSAVLVTCSSRGVTSGIVSRSDPNAERGGVRRGANRRRTEASRVMVVRRALSGMRSFMNAATSLELVWQFVSTIATSSVRRRSAAVAMRLSGSYDIASWQSALILGGYVEGNGGGG